MPKITGKLTDFGIDPMLDADPKITFRFMTEGRPTSAVAGAAVLANRDVEIRPEYNGFFEATLTETGKIAPAGYYLVSVHWRDQLRQRRVDTLPGRLYVPAAGGVLADLLRLPSNPALVWTGPEAPANPSPGSWWQKPNGDIYEWAGEGWNFKNNIRGPAGYNAVGAEATTASLAALARGAAGPNDFLTALRETAARTVSQLDKSNGTDDTAMINTALAAAPAGALITGKPGETYKISAPLVIRSGTTLDMTGCRITLNPGASCSMVHNAQVVADNGRDARVCLRGGYWDRGANGGNSLKHSLHTLVFRRVDGLVIEDVEVATKAGKYAISVAAVTNFRISRPRFDNTYSDGVHIQGPASNGLVEHVRGTTYDDSVAITGNDYLTYADVSGDVTGVVIRDVHTTSTGANLVKVLAGQGCAVDDIAVENVRGTHAQSAVWIGDDNGHESTSNGTHGRITVRDTDTEGLNDNGQIYANIRNGIRELLIEDATLRRGKSTTLVQIGTEGICGLIRVVRGSVDAAGAPAARRLVRIYGTAAANVRRLEIAAPAHNALGGSASMLDSAVSVGVAIISDASLAADDTATTRWVNLTGPSMAALTLTGGQIRGGRSVFEAAAGSAGTYTLTGGVTVSGINRLMNVIAGAPSLYLGEVSITSAINRLVIVLVTAAGLTMTAGDNAALFDGANTLERPGTQPIRVNGRRLRVDLALLTARIGDIVTTANGRGVMPAEHPVIWTGTTWKSLIADLVWP